MQDLTIPANFGALPEEYRNMPVENDLSAGISAGYGLIGYRGKSWSTRYRGDETTLMREDGDGPRNSIEIVMVAASKHISKIWYEAGWVEGSSAPPDCFSTNGIAPELSSPKRQSDVCAKCPHNAWGSKVTPAGKQGKSCSDSKRIAVVPLADIENVTLGGPMLLRVPAASLQDLAGFGTKMAQYGYPYHLVAVRVSFDPNESYPKFIFNAIRPLTADECKKVMVHKNSEQVARILAENSENAHSMQAQPGGTASPFEQPPTGTTSGPAVTTAAPAAAQPAIQTNSPVVAPPPANPVTQNSAPASVQNGGAGPAQGTATIPPDAQPPATAQPTTGSTTKSPFGSSENPTNGQASTTPVQAAAPTVTTPMSPPAQPSQSSPVTQPSNPEVSLNGGAGHAQGAPVNQTDTPSDVSSATPSSGPEQTGEASQFEKDLDAQLADLLPQATT